MTVKKIVAVAATAILLGTTAFAGDNPIQVYTVDDEGNAKYLHGVVELGSTGTPVNSQIKDRNGNPIGVYRTGILKDTDGNPIAIASGGAIYEIDPTVTSGLGTVIGSYNLATTPPTITPTSTPSPILAEVDPTAIFNSLTSPPGSALVASGDGFITASATPVGGPAFVTVPTANGELIIGSSPDAAAADHQTSATPITGEIIADNAVSERTIQDGAVSETKLADNAVSTRTIQADAVRTRHIQDGAVTTGKIAKGAVTFDRLSGGVQKRITSLESEVEELGAGVAMSFAMANAPSLATGIGESSISFGLGHYAGHTAGAIKFSHVPSAATVLNASVGFGDEGDVGIGLGFGFKF